MDTIRLFIDGAEVEAKAGQSLLEASLAAGIYIPHLCSHPCLPVQSTCKLCVVEIEGKDSPKTACSTPAEAGMRVRTKGEQLGRIRRMAIELMLAGHPKDCMGCRSYTNCELQSLIQYLGVTHGRMHTIQRRTNRINIENPLIDRELERCVQCGRCVRVCEAVRGVGVLKYRKLDGECYIGTEGDRPLAETDCRFCSACVEICPTGALQDRKGLFDPALPRAERLIPCQAECPAHIDIPRYVRQISQGRYSDAVAVIREKVPFPHALGYVCNNLCETKCKRGGLDEAVSIRNLKRYAVEHDTEQSWKQEYLARRPSSGRRVAVIGGGPCGLTAAYYLNRQGHEVTVFEKQRLPGGHMTCGMPEYRIPTGDVLAEIAVLEEAGVKILCNREIENAARLKEEYDAVLIAVGTSVGKRLAYLPGSDFRQVYTAVELLRASRLDQPLELGETVCVIGGGNVAFDVAGTLIRMGKRVNVVCLEKDASQASPEERDMALEEGTVLLDCCSSEAILGTPERVTGLRFHRITGFHFDPETRAVVEQAVPDSTEELACDSIVFAAGQITGLTEAFGVALNRFGYPIDTRTGASGYCTSVEGVFAAGDVITGTKFVINAIAGGREAASLIDRYLGGDGELAARLLPDETPSPRIGTVEHFAQTGRQQMELRPAEERRHSCQPVSDGFTCGQAACESGRCLQCDLRLQIEPEKLWTAYSGGERDGADLSARGDRAALGGGN